MSGARKYLAALYDRDVLMTPVVKRRDGGVETLRTSLQGPGFLVPEMVW